jgi:hypothetical protein
MEWKHRFDGATGTQAGWLCYSNLPECGEMCLKITRGEIRESTATIRLANVS